MFIAARIGRMLLNFKLDEIFQTISRSRYVGYTT